MANIFKAKTLVSRTGIFSHEAIAPNLVYNTGNQTISGVKTFAENAVFGDPSQGDFLVISGNTFTVYGSGNFTSGLFVNGNAVLTGVDLSSYATSNNLVLTGSILNNKINNLSGYINSSSSNIVFTTGNQNIGGNKTFVDRLIAKTGFFGDNNFASGNWIGISAGSGNYVSGDYSFIGGGFRNCSTANFSNVAGGTRNCATAISSNIGGGCFNIAQASFSIVGGGSCNCATASFSIVGGGFRNCSTAAYSNVGGGSCNSATANFSNVGGGRFNCATAASSNIGGGCCNCATSISSNIGGGRQNCAIAAYSNVGGGIFNCATSTSSNIGGGGINRAAGVYSNVGGGSRNCATAAYSNVGGGKSNCATAAYSNVGGGKSNCAAGCVSNIGGGCFNIAEGFLSNIGGGCANCVLSSFGYIPGGRCSVVQTNHSGAAVLGDGEDRVHNSFSAHSLTLDFASGVYFSNRKVFGAVPEMVNINNNFTISNTFNSDMILANSSSTITGTIISGNATGFNASIIQIGAGQIQITGSGIGVAISSYNNQYKTAGQFATISILHTGNNRYIMYGNTSL